MHAHGMLMALDVQWEEDARLGELRAHVGTVCDASFTTFMLTHWVRDRGRDPMALEKASLAAKRVPR